MNTPFEVRLQEWEVVQPDAAGELTSRVLAGRRLDCEGTRRLATELANTERIEILELAQGLEIRATSFVGRFMLGDLSINIEPKLPNAPLIQLLRYAYGLRHLDLYDPVDYAPSKWAFQDLLIQQLVSEVRELLERGLHRDYEITRANLHSPRGRIDFRRYIQVANCSSTTLPCIYHPRLEDTFLNQILLAGLCLALELAEDLNLRGSLRRLTSMLRTSVSLKPLDAGLLADSHRRLDRRTTAYKPAITIIALLYGDRGIALEKSDERVQLRGFLFDMNRFFQALMCRFLVDHLDGYDVKESRLKDLFEYDPLRNPLRRHAPALRPDFVISRDTDVIAVLDAKYRDLWERPLPREMLYQLALYALGQNARQRRTVILYPTLNRSACEQAIFIRDPVLAGRHAEVILRPINLVVLDELIRGGTSTFRRRTEMANQMAFGFAMDHSQGSHAPHSIT